MKSNVRAMCISLAAVVVLGCTLVALLLFPPAQEDKPENDDAASIMLLQSDAEDIVSIEVQNKSGTYTFLRDPDKTSGFTIEGLESQDLQDGLVQYATEDSYKLEAVRDFGECDKPEEYGLSQPEASYTIQYKDGTKKTIQVGIEVPGEIGLYYVAVSGNTHVFSAEIYERLLDSPLSYIQTTLVQVSASNDDSDDVKLEQLRLGGSIWPDEVTILRNTDYEKAGATFSDARFIMSTPIYAACGDTDWETLLGQITRVAAECSVSTDVSEESLKKYGLDKPCAEISYILDGEQVSLMVGNKAETQTDDGEQCYYIMSKGGSAIFEIAQSSISAWTDGDFYKFTADKARTFKLEDVERIETSMAGEVHTFTCEMKNGEPDEDGNPQKEWTIMADGKTLTSTNFEIYFDMLSSVQSEGMPEKPVNGQPKFTVTIHYRSELNADPTVIRFYDAGSRRCNVVYNDEECYVMVRDSFVDELIENTRRCAENMQISFQG